MGKPPIEIDMNKLEAYMGYGPTLSATAAYFRTSEDTIGRRIREEHDLSFAEFRDRFFEPTRTRLKQEAMVIALDRNHKDQVKVLLRSLEQYCDWKNTIDHSGKLDGGPQVIITLPDNGRDRPEIESDLDDEQGEHG